MEQTMTYNRTTLNNIDWQIVRTFLGGYALYRKDNDNYVFSGYTFRTMEDAVKHLDAIDARVKAPVQFNINLDCSSFYDRGTNVYYGD